MSNRYHQALLGTALALTAFCSSVCAQERTNDQLHYATYVNVRFGFQVEYPPGLLNPQRASDNNDGRAFKSQDGRVTLIAFGHYLMDDETSQSLASAAEVSCPGHKAAYRVVKPKLVVVSCQTSNTITYEKTIISGDTAVTLDASYPAPEKDVWDEVVAHVSSSMRFGK